MSHHPVQNPVCILGCDLILGYWLLIHTMFFVLFLKMPWFHQSKYLISNQNIRLPIKILSRTVPSWATPLHAHQWGTLSAPSFRLSNNLKFKRKYLQNRNIVNFVPRWLWVWIILIIEWEYRERLKESFFENIESFLRDYRELLLYRVVRASSTWNRSKLGTGTRF